MHMSHRKVNVTAGTTITLIVSGHGRELLYAGLHIDARLADQRPVRILVAAQSDFPTTDTACPLALYVERASSISAAR